MTKITKGPICLRTLAILSLIIGVPSAAQTQGLNSDGEVTGSIGEMAYQGRIPVHDTSDAEFPSGAYYTVEQEGANRMVHMVITATAAMFPGRGQDGVYGNDTVRIELGFVVPTSAGDTDLSQDMMEWSLLTYFEVWPSGVRVPALHYSTLYRPPEVSLSTLGWGEDGISVAGTVSGEACLYFWDADERGNMSPTGARIMGETVCPDVALEFSALARQFTR